MKKHFAIFGKLVMIMSLAFAIIVAPGFMNNEAQAAQNIKVYLDGQQMSFSVQPRVEYGTTLVPMRAIFESLGADVQYNGSQKKITATKGSTQIVLYLNNKTAYVNNAAKTLERPAKAINGVTLVPLRFVSESLNADVGWNGSTQTVTINTKGSNSNIQVDTPNVTVAINGTAYICLTPNPAITDKQILIMPGYDKNVITAKWVNNEVTPEGKAYIEVQGLQEGQTTVDVCFEGSNVKTTAKVNVVPAANIAKFYQGTDVPTYQYATDISASYSVKKSTKQQYSEYVPGCDYYYYFIPDVDILGKYINVLQQNGYKQSYNIRENGTDLVTEFYKGLKTVGITIDVPNNTLIIDVSLAR